MKHATRKGTHLDRQRLPGNLNRAIAGARRRLWLQRVLVAAVWVAVAVLVIGIGLRVGERVLAWPIDAAMGWGSVGLFLVAGWVLGTLIAAVVVRPGVGRAALELDRCAELGERVSTALEVAGSDDAWSQAVVADAGERVAGSKGRDAVRAVPVELPRSWGAPFVAAMAGAVVWLALPQFDLSGELAAQQEEEERAAEVVRVKEEIAAQETELEKQLAEAGLAEPEQNEQAEGLEGRDPEELKRNRIKQLTSLKERIEQQQAGATGEQKKALEEAMKKLKRPGPGPAEELARALARGEFNKAKQKLQELQQKLEEGELSEAERQQLSEQMQNLSEQIRDAAREQRQAQERIADELERQGMSREQAERLAEQAMQNPEQFREAMENAGMSAEEAERLAEQAEGARSANQQMQQMSQQMMEMAEQLSQMAENGQMSQQLAEAMSQMAESMAGMASAQGQFSAMSQAAQMAQQQLAQLAGSMTAEQWDQMFGSGADSDSQGPSGPNRGQGSGAGPEEEMGFATRDEQKANVVNQGGPIIGSAFVEGSQVIGESRAALSDAVRASGSVASEALESNAVPVEYHDAVKRYFGQLAERVSAEQAEDAPPASTETAEGDDE